MKNKIVAFIAKIVSVAMILSSFFHVASIRAASTTNGFMFSEDGVATVATGNAFFVR